ncbi:hypothetical protein E2562_000404 [Oryza meyeriana var. granulata]|uniref:Uncharacterized protein n=1 Tax=Oryza meyeriana var. granulata TaxID=110450 RepID=A0A6G1CC32_9ORYZ|nr:hypothetical protein E2562_000404 [Oryza meyeriana var. granulata]
MVEVAVSGGAGVRVLAVSRVAPAPAQVEERVGLSFFDTPWVVLPPIQRVFLYETTAVDEGDGDGFAAAVERLKGSLAATLALYLPLAGKLAYVAETGDVVVDCGADAGVAFVEAEADAAAVDVRRLAGDEAHDMAAFVALVPELDTRVLPAPLLSVQATRLGAGLALGLSIHHAVADGRAVWQFMEAWSSAARVGSPVTKSLGPPHYSREAVIPHPNGSELARQMLKMVAPKLPVASAVEYDFTQRFRLARRTFYLDANVIRSLKRRIDELASAEAAAGGEAKPVSTFVALAAMGWTAFVRSKGLATGDDTYLVFLADLRARLDPPVGEGYIGNCVKMCLATCPDAAELLGERGLLRAARAVQAAVAEMEAAPLAGTDGSVIARMMQLPFTRLANVAASPRFRAYDAADFGFGKPARVELVSMNHDGEMVLVGGRRDGEVQLSVSINPAHVDAFKAQVLG